MSNNGIIGKLNVDLNYSLFICNRRVELVGVLV